MPKPNPSLARNPHMPGVHALGHPDSPPPRTGWSPPPGGWAGAPPIPAPLLASLFLPYPPSDVSLSEGSGSALVVTWTAPSVDGTHGAATTFNVRSSPAGAGSWTTTTAVTSPYMLSGLAAGAAFDVEVQGTNGAGAGAWSPVSTLTAAPVGPYAPNAPSIASVAPPTDGTASNLTVTWTAPPTDSTHGGATGYTLRSSPSGVGTWTTVSGVTSPYTITGLAGATAVDVEVQGTNAAANPGAWSATMTGTTWGATVTPGNWVAASTQAHGASVAPSGGVNLIAVAAPSSVTGGAFAWSASPAVVPTTGLISGGADGQTNGWGQWFSAPATAGTWYLWLLAQGSGGTIGALVTGAITVT